MSSLSRWLSLAVVLLLAAPGAARAQAYASDAPVLPPDTASLRTEPQAPLTQRGQLPPAATSAPEAESNGAILDGHLRYGAFLSGPGSLTFILHHSLMGAAGGFFTQGIANGFSFERSAREAMLAGTLIGAGLGFGSAAWWQFYNWVDKPMGYFGIANSVVGGMFAAGFMDLLTRDANLGLVVLDLRRAPPADLRRIPGPQWYRLQRAVEPTDLALIVLTPRASVVSAQLRFVLDRSHPASALGLERPALVAQLAPTLQRQRLPAAAAG